MRSILLLSSVMSQNPLIFDRDLIRARARRAKALGAATFLIDRVAADLAERLAVVTREFPLAVDLGTPTDAVRSALAGVPSVGTVVAAGADVDRADGSPAVVADPEALPFATGALDLLVSALALQAVNDLPGALIQIRRALRPD